MAPPITPPSWAAEGWLEAVGDWAREHAARAGLLPNGSLEQVHAAPWSVVLRLPVEGGSVYFKETAPGVRHEVGVSALLARLQPGRVLPVLAVDAERRWMLMPDAGPTLRSTIRTDRDLTHWDRVLRQYAELQIELAGHVDELLGAGVPDRRLERFPDLVAGVLDDVPSLLIGKDKGLSRDEYERAVALMPTVRDLSLRLASLGIPPSIHHGDLHDGNVFYDGSRYLIFDWSDSVITHPFVSLRTAMVSVCISFELEESPEVEREVSLRLWEGYGPAWKAFGSPEELREAFDLARRLWAIPTLLTWYRWITSLEGETRTEYAWIIPEVVRELLLANQ